MSNQDEAVRMIEAAFQRQLGRAMNATERQMVEANLSDDDEDADTLAELAAIEAGWSPHWDHSSGSAKLVLDLD